jgi:hypothetical protein
VLTPWYLYCMAQGGTAWDKGSTGTEAEAALCV